MGGGGRAEFALLLIVALVGSPLSAVISDDIWLPAEIFTVKEGDDPVTGYLLSNEDGEATILLDEDRRTVILSEDAVAERKRCSLPFTGAPVWDLLGSPAGYEKCPSH